MKSDWLIVESNIIGLIGVTFVLYAYFMLQIGKMHQSSIWFSLLNVLGSLCIMYSLYFHWNLASAFIEAVWLIISLFGLIKSIIDIKKE